MREEPKARQESGLVRGFRQFPSATALVACDQGADTGGMNNAEHQSEAILLETSGLEFRFPRIGDRYGLTISLRSELVLEALAGSETDAWPAAPPLQQLHEQELPAGLAVLGVGSAGTSHWSASFSVRGPGLVWCEYAARVSHPWNHAGEWLGTRFHLAKDWNWERAERGLRLLRRDQQLLLELLGEESEWEMVRPNEVAFRPAQGFPQRTKTVEWRAAIRLS